MCAGQHGTALSPESGTKAPSRPRPPPGDGPVRSAGAAVRVQHWPGWPGLAEAQARGPARRHTVPCRQLSARGTPASYRAGPTSAVGLGLPTQAVHLGGSRGGCHGWPGPHSETTPEHPVLWRTTARTARALAALIRRVFARRPPQCRPRPAIGAGWAACPHQLLSVSPDAAAGPRLGAPVLDVTKDP